MENKTIQIIKNRTSCKGFSVKKVSTKKIETIVECAKSAPTAMNRQIIKIMALKSKRHVEKLRKLCLSEANRDCLYGAPVAILVYGPRDDRFTVTDASCALENIFLAASALSINSCWINQFDDLFNTKTGKKIKKSLGIDENMMIVGTAAIGYKRDDYELVKKPRKEDMAVIK